jgi:hypothetical protein
MHNIIIAELKYYFDIKFGTDLWPDIMKEIGQKPPVLPSQDTPDHVVIDIISRASKITKKPVNEILEEFGEFVTPYLVRMYRPLIKSEWSTIDLVENAEQTIHKIVRMKNPGASPPELKCSRPSYEEVIIIYNSQRKMCGILKGIAKGLAKHYGQKIHIIETNCMQKGDPNCRISIMSKK